MIGRIKVLLDIEDDKQDDVLNIIIGNVTSHLSGLLEKEVPDELNFIIEEISIRRFNRKGTEGKESESVESHSVKFYDLEKEFTPYEKIIDAHKDPPQVTGRGKVILI